MHVTQRPLRLGLSATSNNKLEVARGTERARWHEVQWCPQKDHRSSYTPASWWASVASLRAVAVSCATSTVTTGRKGNTFLRLAAPAMLVRAVIPAIMILPGCAEGTESGHQQLTNRNSDANVHIKVASNGTDVSILFELATGTQHNIWLTVHSLHSLYL